MRAFFRFWPATLRSLTLPFRPEKRRSNGRIWARATSRRFHRRRPSLQNIRLVQERCDRGRNNSYAVGTGKYRILPEFSIFRQLFRSFPLAGSWAMGVFHCRSCYIFLNGYFLIGQPNAGLFLYSAICMARAATKLRGRTPSDELSISFSTGMIAVCFSIV